MEIEVGDYVRTEKGIIDKVIGFKDDLILFEKDSLCEYKSLNSIVKHSKDIMDLFEENDIVFVTFWHDPDDFDQFVYNIKDIDEFKYEIETGIITLDLIVTKEIFFSVGYKVGEE